MRSNLEKASWCAGILGTGVAIFSVFQTSNTTQPILENTGPGATQVGTVAGNLIVNNNTKEAPPISTNGEASVPQIFGVIYDDARKRLIEAGWTPVQQNHLHIQELGEYGNGKIFWERGYWEVESCSGTGAGFCLFRFSDPRGRVLRVVTQGEESTPGDGEYHATVAHHEFERPEAGREPQP